MMMLAKVVGCWLIADFTSGFWHWLEDRYFDERWPVIGKYIAKPNALHHAQPAAFLHQPYWSRNWTSIVPAAVAVAIVLVSGGGFWSVLPVVMVSQANEVHAWAHQRVQARWVLILQEMGALQSPRHHGVHHRSPFDVRYCVMSDWLNPVLDASRFWLALEWCLAKVAGIKPKAV